MLKIIPKLLIIIKKNVAIQCTIIIAFYLYSNTRNDNNYLLVMFEHSYSQQMKHLGTSQTRVLKQGENSFSSS